MSDSTLPSHCSGCGKFLPELCHIHWDNILEHYCDDCFKTKMGVVEAPEPLGIHYEAFILEEYTCDCGQDMRSSTEVKLRKMHSTRGATKSACFDLLNKKSHLNHQYVILSVYSKEAK